MVATKISNRFWAKRFTGALTFPAGSPAKRLAILGIGNELNADDAVGVSIIRGIVRRLGKSTSDRLLLIYAGPSPENFTAPLRRFQPELVLLVDAVQMQSNPGTTAWIEWQKAAGFSASTHTLPPTLFGQFLVHEIGCQVALLGVQVSSVEFDQPMTPAVKRAAARISGRLAKILRDTNY